MAIRATAIGISKSSVACYFHLFNLQPCRTDSFKLPTDPFFIERLRDLVGLYLSPPDNALEHSEPMLPMGFG